MQQSSLNQTHTKIDKRVVIYKKSRLKKEFFVRVLQKLLQYILQLQYRCNTCNASLKVLQLVLRYFFHQAVVIAIRFASIANNVGTKLVFIAVWNYSWHRYISTDAAWTLEQTRNQGITKSFSIYLHL